MIKDNEVDMAGQRTKRGAEEHRSEFYQEQKKKIVQAAYKVIAEKGFEGLRMREVAQHAGLDHATIHYYFTGKESLITAVLEYIVEDMSIGRTRSESAVTSARGRLATHFKQHQRQTKDHPEMFVFLTEINARSMRDEKIRAIVEQNDERWLSFVREILDAGLQTGEFHPNLDVDATATLIIAAIRGLTVTSGNSDRRMARPLRQLERFLLPTRQARTSPHASSSED